MRFGLFLSITVFQIFVSMAHSTELLVAVASNFRNTFQILAPIFEKQTNHHLTPSFGSSGKLYAQIHHGAPFQAFMAADAEFPRKLTAEGKTIGPPVHYATGILVFWHTQPGTLSPTTDPLTLPTVQRVAVANPELAPYGQAAQAFLTKRQLWQPWQAQHRLIIATDVGQVAAFVASGAVDGGFVALSQVKTAQNIPTGSVWTVPQNDYPPMRQEAVLLKDAAQVAPLNVQAGQDWLNFLVSPAAQAILAQQGYQVP